MDVRFRYDAPNVYVAGTMQPNMLGITSYLEQRGLVWNAEEPNPAMLMELGGRICYESFHNPAGRTRDEYLRKSILEAKHGSVLEHVSISFIVEGLSRSILMELTRHRAGVAYSWRSTRFVDSYLEFLVPYHVQQSPAATTAFKKAVEAAIEAYEIAVEEVDPGHDIPKTLQRKRKRENARQILGGNLTADGLFTCNIRALRHIIQLRTDEHADYEFRRFGWNLFEAARYAVPEGFSDATIRMVGGVNEVRFANNE